MGNRPRPTRLKLLQGNPSKRPINLFEPEPPQAKPTMPKWLKAFPVAVKEWRRESRIINEMGILTLAEEGDLAMRCFLAAKIQELAGGKDTKELNKIKNLITEYRQLGGLLGLDPTNRTRLKTETKKPKSKAQEFRNRKNGTQA